jgi:catechol-2,3-dioxygenase
MKVADHGISLGIYFQDPDGNGIEVYYGSPRNEWHRQEGIFMGEGRPAAASPGLGMSCWRDNGPYPV